MTQNKMLVMIPKLYFYEAIMLEYSTGVRFLGVKDIAKVTQSVLEYSRNAHTTFLAVQRAEIQQEI